MTVTNNNEQGPSRDKAEHMCTNYPRTRRPAWINAHDSHDVVLTEEYLSTAPVGTVLSVLVHTRSQGNRLPISVEKQHDDTWNVHSRANVRADQLVGGLATQRKRRGSEDHAEPLPIPEPVQEASEQQRASFGAAAAFMARGVASSSQASVGSLVELDPGEPGA